MTPERPLQIGQYKIVSLLGKGGMGEVYRARDLNLKRDVAIKVLPELFGTDRDAVKRLQREAQLLASLNHPNIAIIHDLVESEGTHALVLELVEGPTLAERIMQGPLSVDDALKIARQIADALEAAHEQGIIHRDLKPANVKLRGDGTVKVLDFGLAKTLDTTHADSHWQTTALLDTGTGVVLGTPAYMSPEQTRGQALDKRSDIWAFGCVLYEMLAGRRPFKGESVPDMLAAVVRDEPDLGRLPPQTPPGIHRLIRRCLAKDRRDRLPDIGVARLEIKDAWIPETSSMSVAPPRARPGGVRLAWYATAVLAVIATTVIVGFRLRTPPVQQVTKFSVLSPAGTAFANIAVGGPPAISPDGRMIAFVAGSAGKRQIWLQPLGSLEARALPDTDGASTPFWSSDGKSLGFLVAGRLKKVNVSGGTSEVIVSDVTGQIGSVGSWGVDGAILFSPRGTNLAEVSAAGGPVTAVTAMDPSLMEENHVWPEFLPDGRRYLYHVRAGTQLELQVYIGERGSRNRTLLLTGVSRAQYAPPRERWPGHLLYVRDGTLMAQPFAADRLVFTGPPVAIANNVATTAVGTGGDFSVSANGTLAYRVGDAAEQELAWFSRQGAATTAAAKRPGRIGAGMRRSPDGTTAAYTWLTGQQPDIWLLDFIRGLPTRFTFNTGAAPAWSPTWSPDGREVAFVRKDGIYRMGSTGGTETLLWKDDRVLAVNDWSGDGKTLLVTRWDKDGAGRGLWLVSVDRSDKGSGPSPDRKPVLFHAPALHGQFVPGTGPPTFVAFDSDEAGRREIFVKSMPGQAPGRWQISNDGGNAARWRRDGRELFYMGPRALMAVDIDLDPSFRHGVPQSLFQAPRGLAAAVAQYAPSYDVTADGSKFLLPAPGPDAPASAIHVILNWQAALAN